jgi:hypothetical protein
MIMLVVVVLSLALQAIIPFSFALDVASKKTVIAHVEKLGGARKKRLDRHQFLKNSDDEKKNMAYYEYSRMLKGGRNNIETGDDYYRYRNSALQNASKAPKSVASARQLQWSCSRQLLKNSDDGKNNMTNYEYSRMLKGGRKNVEPGDDYYRYRNSALRNASKAPKNVASARQLQWSCS